MGKGLTKREWVAQTEQFQSDEMMLMGLAREGQVELLSTIHEQIIPRLVLAHLEEVDQARRGADSRIPPTQAEVFQFARLSVEQDLPTMLGFFEQLVREGVSPEVLLLQLISPAARLLGDEWSADDISFAEVILGLRAIEQVVHILGPSFSPAAPDRGFVVLTTTAGEQHTLGVHLLGELLRSAGWAVQVMPNLDEGELISLVESERVELLGISANNRELFGSLPRLVKCLMNASMNPRMAVMLGGCPDLASHARELGVWYCKDPSDVVTWLAQHIDTTLRT